MRAEFRIARIFGVDIFLHWTFPALVGLLAWAWHGELGWFWSSAAAVIFIFSILFHEMAHVLAGKKLGISINAISLFIFGGGAHLGGENFLRSYRPKAEFLMAIAGPLSSLLVAGIFYALSLAWGKPLEPVFSLLFILSIIIAIFNMLPLFPMDGGRILRCVLCAITKNLAKATKIALVVTMILGALLFILSFAFLGIFSGIWIGSIVFMVISMARAEYRAVQVL